MFPYRCGGVNVPGKGAKESVNVLERGRGRRVQIFHAPRERVKVEGGCKIPMERGGCGFEITPVGVCIIAPEKGGVYNVHAPGKGAKSWYSTAQS